MGGAMPDTGPIDDRPDRFRRDHTFGHRANALDRVRAPLFDGAPAFKPRPSFGRPDCLEYRFLLLEERMGSIRCGIDRTCRALRAARGIYGSLLQVMGLLGTRSG